MEMKRTTIRLPAELKKELKLIGAEEDKTFNVVVISALRWFVQQYKEGKISKDVFYTREGKKKDSGSY